MATIQEILDMQMKQVGDSIRQFMFPRLRQQVPRPGNTPQNPYATGKLARSLTPNMIKFEKGADNQWELFIDLDALPAGVRKRAQATNFGSGPRHNEFDTIRQNGIFGLPFMGYSKGTMGIRAQNWTAMDGFESRVNKLVQDKLNVSMERLVRETIKDYIS
jgi:hypothetical protein